jgi:hypothetical protein
MIATKLTMTASQAFVEIARREISIVPSFDGSVWTASVDIKGTGHNRKRALRAVTATSSTPIGAIEKLIEKLDYSDEK